jgi:hypothetical protein
MIKFIVTIYVIAVISIVVIGGIFIRYSDSLPNDQSVTSTISTVTAFNSNITSEARSSSSETTFSTSSPISVTVPPNSSLVQSSAISSNGLFTTLRLSTSQITSGQAVTISVNETNALSSENTINEPFPRLSDFATKGLTQAPCPFLTMMAIYQGYYTYSNITNSQALQLFTKSGVAGCPYYGTIEMPASSSKMILGNTTYPFGTSYSFSGYYNYSIIIPPVNVYNANETNNCMPTVAHPDFPSGIYTVLSGDEWGSMAILHLTVLG